MEYEHKVYSTGKVYWAYDEDGNEITSGPYYDEMVKSGRRLSKSLLKRSMERTEGEKWGDTHTLPKIPLPLPPRVHPLTAAIRATQ